MKTNVLETRRRRRRTSSPWPTALGENEGYREDGRRGTQVLLRLARWPPRGRLHVTLTCIPLWLASATKSSLRRPSERLRRIWGGSSPKYHREYPRHLFHLVSNCPGHSFGSKASLINRIKHVENRQNSPDSATSIHRRDSSTVHRSTPSATSPSLAASTLNVKLPDLSAPQELPAPHIVGTFSQHFLSLTSAFQPFLPDFWDSSRSRGADAIRHDVQAETPMRKVLVVAGTSTPHAGGPTYGPSDSDYGDDHAVSKATASTSAPGLWRDVTEDFGLPQSFDPRAPLTKARDAIVSAFDDAPHQKHEPAFQSRPLDQDEVKGLWALLLIFGGSWLAGGMFDGSKKKKPSPKS